MSQSFFEIGKNSSNNFLNNLKNDKHLLLLYEDVEKAADIQINYIIQGLENEECCVIAMPPGINFLEKLQEKNIDIENYQRKNLLYVLDVPKREDFSNDVEVFKFFSTKIMSLNSGKLRICGMLDFDLSKKEGMNSFIKAEATSHQNFNSFNGSWLCSYDISKIESKEKMMWLRKLFRCHDSVMVVPAKDSGIAFDLT